ncbi:hypothetical protein ACX3YC_15015 [Pseudomonas mohnii]
MALAQHLKGIIKRLRHNQRALLGSDPIRSSKPFSLARFSRWSCTLSLAMTYLFYPTGRQAGNIGLFQNKQEMIDLYTNQLNMLEDQRDAEADIAKWQGEQARPWPNTKTPRRNWKPPSARE